jgi:hypothetical protein
MWILDSYVFYLLPVKKKQCERWRILLQRTVPIRFPPFSFSPLLKQDPPPQQLEFTLTALCTAQVGSFFAVFLSFLDECCVKFASLEFPQKRSFKP